MELLYPPVHSFFVTLKQYNFLHGRIPGVFIRTIKTGFRILFYILGILLLILTLPTLVSWLFARSKVFSIEKVAASRTAIVFGAGLYRDGSPSPVLRDRVATAVDLYNAGKVTKLLLSGDNSTIFYNEPESMKAYALSLGVPADDIVLDYAGRRTYDTCFRARSIFGLKDAILVTQDYHLPRALLTCNALGLSSVGVKADRRVYLKRSSAFWRMREVPATAIAKWQVWISKPQPVLGTNEPIFPDQFS